MPCSGKTDQPAPGGAAAPSITGFVLYGERGLHLGERDVVRGGDVGVHAIVEASRGSQLEIGAHAALDRRHNVFAPTVRLGRDATFGVLQVNVVHDGGVPLRAPLAYPAAAMPPLPTAPPPPGAGADVTVAAGAVVAALLPGSSSTATPGGRGHAAAQPWPLRLREHRAGRRRPADRDRRGGADPRGRHPHGRAARPHLSRLRRGRRPDDHRGLGPRRQRRRAGRLDRRALVRAGGAIAARTARLSIADKARATGAFAGFDIAVGEEVRIDFQCGFPAEKPGDRGSQQLQGYYGPHPDPTVAPLAGPVPADTVVPLAVGLPVRDKAGLKAFIA